MSIIPRRTAPSVGLRAQLTQLVPPASVPTVDAVRRQLADGTGIVVLTPGCTDKNDKTRLTGRPAVLQAPDGTDKNDENLAARVRHAAAHQYQAMLSSRPGAARRRR